MEFELTLSGVDWLAELKRLGAINAGNTLEVPVSMGVGQAQHTATARVTLTTR
jgi:hypothetical protein